MYDTETQWDTNVSARAHAIMCQPQASLSLFPSHPPTTPRPYYGSLPPSLPSRSPRSHMHTNMHTYSVSAYTHTHTNVVTYRVVESPYRVLQETWQQRG